VNQSIQNSPAYAGFEQGPIRPPSEARSLLIRVTRNCPWNRCTFCPVYKGSRFSIRPVEHVKQDIDGVSHCVDAIREGAEKHGKVPGFKLKSLFGSLSAKDPAAYQAALHWAAGGMRSIFLQDANSLIMKPEDVIDILGYLKEKFPWVARVTSYARSHTISRISDPHLRQMRDAGLNRIHIGLESGSDEVLKLVKKGSNSNTHIKAGLKVKKAGMELSEYVMPGLGGRRLSFQHATDTAETLNRINPDFIRLRTLAIPNHVPLSEAHRSGAFEKCTDVEMAEEILTFLRTLEGITSRIASDHILNLFQEIDGTLPEDKPRMMAVLEEFLEMTPEKQILYQIGRRLGYFQSLEDLASPSRRARAEKVRRELNITPDNVDRTIEELMKRFI